MMMLILTTVLAATTPTAAAPTNTAPTADTSTSATIKADRKRYCFIDDVTGSRLPVKTCKSRADWTALGVDVVAKAAR